MKVVHIINALPKIGGAERLILDIARSHFPARMRVITWLNTDVSLCDQDSDDALEVLVMRPVTIAKLQQAIYWIHDADILHVHLFPSLYLAAFLPGLKIYTEHNTWNRRRSHRFLCFLERIVYRRYDHVVAISDAVRFSLIDWVSSKALPITVIDNGVPLNRFHGVVRELRQNVDNIILGMAGSFSDQKNQDFLVRVLVYLPKKVRLVFAGDGPRRLEVEMLAHTLGVAEQVTFLGNVDDMSAFYSELDVYIQSAYWEGFGLTVVEAMASGLPCLASNVPGVAEVVGDPNKLFNNNDENRLISIIELLIVSSAQYNEWSLYSLERARCYSIDRMVDAYDQLYDTIVSD